MTFAIPTVVEPAARPLNIPAFRPAVPWHGHLTGDPHGNSNSNRHHEGLVTAMARSSSINGRSRPPIPMGRHPVPRVGGRDVGGDRHLGRRRRLPQGSADGVTYIATGLSNAAGGRRDDGDGKQSVHDD